jgi:signal transduction histidine kinase/phage shock protein PspC (stress-responsive transcriptional regulator)
MSQAQVTPRRAYRSPDRLLGGVAAGLAEHLGVAPVAVRLGFVLLTPMALFGPALYLAMWAFVPASDHRDDVRDLPPGMAAASRDGRRPRIQMTRRDIGLAAAVITLGLGVAFLLQTLGLGVRSGLFWPLVVGATGLVLVWLQFDETERSEYLGVSNWRGWLRIALGATLIIGAVVIALLQAGKFQAVWGVVGVLILAILGTLLVVGPWFVRLWRDLQDERAERVRTQERADVAAHLHDSVLQTLALIQRQASDPKAVATLARTQERELRRWLFAADDDDPTTLKAALRSAAGDVEATHTIPVELVVVGDVALDEHTTALVKSTREAMVNAAKHSGASRIDVYAEVASDQVEIFVRDRGRGFDPAGIPTDRMGVRGSVVDRMERHGGSAVIGSEPGNGTEVRLTMPVTAAGNGANGEEDGS